MGNVVAASAAAPPIGRSRRVNLAMISALRGA